MSLLCEIDRFLYARNGPYNVEGEHIMRVFSDRILVAIDIGTTKICVFVAERFPNGSLGILGMGQAPSIGLKKGVVVNINDTIESIVAAVREAEKSASMSIAAAYIGISGSHITAHMSSGTTRIKRRVVRQEDIVAALASARALAIPEDQQILHALPQSFSIDNQEQVHDPLGMYGTRLDVAAHIITGSMSAVNNLISCCERAHVRVRGIMLESLASAHAVLSRDEQDVGAGIIDIGGGACDVAVYYHGAIRYTKIIPVAGTQFTRDIMIGLRTTLDDAERIKKQYGSASIHTPHKELSLNIACVDGIGTQEYTVADIHAIINARAQELFLLIKHEIERYDVRRYMTSGLILTGGGSLLQGIDTVAREILDMPVRIGIPRGIDDVPLTAQSPMYATAYGLLLGAAKKSSSTLGVANDPMTRRIFATMRSWVTDLF